jgi:hypothetical protein
MQGISWLTENLLASQEGLCFMESVRKYVSEYEMIISLYSFNRSIL